MPGFRKGAAYREIRAYRKAWTGLSVSSLYLSQIKRKCGLDAGLNYDPAKKKNVRVSQCPPEKEEAVRAARDI